MSLIQVIINGRVIVTSDNCTVSPSAQKGFVYSTNNQPNINDNLVTSTEEQFNVTLTNLNPSTTYYVRAFTSSNGEYYGNEISFTTLPPSSTINYGINEFEVEPLMKFLDNTLSIFLKTITIVFLHQFYLLFMALEDQITSL